MKTIMALRTQIKEQNLFLILDYNRGGPRIPKTNASCFRTIKKGSSETKTQYSSNFVFRIYTLK